MFRKTLIAALALGLLVTACGRRRTVSLRRLPRNPPSLPTTPTSTGGQLDPQVARSAVAGFELYQYFEQALQEKGLYTPDICIQLVKMTKGSQELGQYIELSNTTCTSSSVAAENEVLIRLKVEQNAQYNTQYNVIIEQSASPVVGRFRKITDNGVDKFRMEGLCNVDAGGYNESWDTFCSIAVESSKFRSPDPLDTYNLD